MKFIFNSGKIPDEHPSRNIQCVSSLKRSWRYVSSRKFHGTLSSVPCLLARSFVCLWHMNRLLPNGKSVDVDSKPGLLQSFHEETHTQIQFTPTNPSHRDLIKLRITKKVYLQNAKDKMKLQLFTPQWLDKQMHYSSHTNSSRYSSSPTCV